MPTTLGPKISAKEYWTGNKPPLGACTIRCVYDTNIQQWVVTMATWDTITTSYRLITQFTRSST